MRTLVKRAQADAGLEATGNVHILRHTFCTRLAMAGKPPTVIQELAGHKRLTTTMRYITSSRARRRRPSGRSTGRCRLGSRRPTSPQLPRVLVVFWPRREGKKEPPGEPGG